MIWGAERPCAGGQSCDLQQGKCVEDVDCNEINECDFAGQRRCDDYAPEVYAECYRDPAGCYLWDDDT